MSDYTERVNALREHADLIEKSGAEVYGPSATRLLVYDLRNAAAAIEELEAEVEEQKQIASHYEQTAKDYWKEACDYKAEVKRLQDKLCDWCAVCPKERRKPEDCELLGENQVMYGPSGAKMEVQE